MITLITGIPGMGKTSYLVTLLLEYEKEAKRPIFVMGIPDLKIEHIVAPPVAEWTEYRTSPEDPSLKLAYFTFPPNSILVIDEAQRVFQPRASASKKPPFVEALETHRHTGLDIICLSQKPKLLDSNLREMVGKHIHIRAGLLGRFLYEWPHIADGESRLDRSEAAKRKFSPPKAAFQKYKSAEIHTKHKFRLNQLFVYAGLALVFLVYQWTQIAGIFNKYMGGEQVQAAQLSEAGQATRSGALTDPALLAPPQQPVKGVPLSLAEATTPTDLENPLSAPLYVAVAPPVVAPQIVGCIASAKSCACFTQQATPIFVPEPQCRERAAGVYYDPYFAPPPPAPPAPVVEKSPAPAPSPEDQTLPPVVPS